MPHTIDREGRSHAVIRGAAPIAVGGRFPARRTSAARLDNDHLDETICGPGCGLNDRPEPACTPLAEIRRNRDEPH